MKKIILPLILLVSLSFFFTACVKPVVDPGEEAEIRLPGMTNSGANTFGCLLNSKSWVPVTTACGTNGVFVNMKYHNPDLLVLDFGARNGNDRIWFRLINPEQLPLERQTTATYQLNANTTGVPFPGVSVMTSNQPNIGIYQKGDGRDIDVFANNYITSSQLTGHVTLTAFDRNHHVLAGTFEFTGGFKNTKGETEKATVTKGRFDIQLR